MALMCVIDVPHWCIHGGCWGGREDRFLVEGREYLVRVPWCVSVRGTGPVRFAASVLSETIHRTLWSKDDVRRAIRYRWFKTSNERTGSSLYTPAADFWIALRQIPCYASSYACYWVARDVVRLLRQYQLVRFRCDICRRLIEREVAARFGTSCCSAACAQVAGRRAWNAYLAQQREKRAWRRNKQLLRNLRRVLKGCRKCQEASESPHEASTQAETSPTS